MEIRVRKEGGVCSPDPKYQGREGDPPTPVVRGQATRGRAHSRRPGCQVSAAPGGMGWESASSARSRMLGALVFSRDCRQALGCPGVISYYIKVSTVTPTLQVGKTESQSGLPAPVGDQDPTGVSLAWFPDRKKKSHQV